MLLGENGAGKSSLIKVLYGAYRADAGTILFEGNPVEIARPADARRLGIAVIFQEFSLVPFLDLAQNIFLGREPRRPLTRLIDHARMHREARAVLDSLRTRLRYAGAGRCDLGVAQQQMVEIAKALSQRARILVMDEPTAALSERETEALFAADPPASRLGRRDRLHLAPAAGSLRARRPGDGAPRRAAAWRRSSASEATADQLIGMMVGRAVGAVYKRRHYGSAGQGRAGGARTRPPRPACATSTSTCAKARSSAWPAWSAPGRTEVARAVFGADADRRRRSPHLRRDRRRRPGADRRARRRADPREPQARRPGAQALGSGQPAGRKPVEALSARLVSRGAGASGMRAR